MAVDVVIGGQRGDEGKGNFCLYLGLNGDYHIAIRSASPQAGHSIYINGKRVGLAHLPCAAVNKNIRLLLGAASFLYLPKLFYGGKEYLPYKKEIIDIIPEIPTLGLTPERLGIDYRAKIVTESHKERERKDERLMKRGSVGSGVNKAKDDLLYKQEDTLPFITSDPELKKFAVDTTKELYDALMQNKHILFETDHGMELCQNFGVFPYNTARNINTSAYLGEVGLPPQCVRDIYLVIKPYISAVAKDGPLKEEITNPKVLEELIGHGGETGSMSGRTRRIGKFDFESFKNNIKMSGTTKIAISHLDLSEEAWNETGFAGESDLIEQIRKTCRETWPYPKISLLSYGPESKDIMRVN